MTAHAHALKSTEALAILDEIRDVRDRVERLQEGVHEIKGTQGILLQGMLDLSARMARNEGPPPAPATHSRPTHPSVTSEALRALTEETRQQTPMLDDLGTRVDSMAPMVERSSRRQWVTIVLLVLQTLAGVAYALGHGHGP